MNKKLASNSVAVILGFYNGEKYLKDQLESIISQTHKNLKIFIFDDNSEEGLNKLKLTLNNKLHPKIKIIKRVSNIGYAKNFLFGLKDVGQKFDYYAFSDQDDIWKINKIELAIKKMNVFKSSKSLLYCSRTAYFTEDCSKEIGSSRIFKKGPEFKNALIQNIAGGNTILMNKEARNIIIKTLKKNEFVSHDWWCYQVITASGGKVIFDHNKTLKYRQHSDNIIGKNVGFLDKLKRLNSFFSGNYKRWCEININNLYKNKELITKRNLEILFHFTKARNSKNPIEKIIQFYKSGIFRQSKLETIFLVLGLLLNKI